MTCISGRLTCLVSLAGLVLTQAVVLVAQRGELRELVRTQGDINRMMISCGPPTGLKEIVAHTQVTLEGTITRADAALYEGDRDEFVYTDYMIDVIRVFRFPPATTRATPGATLLTPFLAGVPTTHATPTALRARLRAPFHGRVILDGGSITDTSGFPTLSVGQHIIASAYFNSDLRAWIPFGVFEVRDKRVVPLDKRLQTRDYESVEEFTAALANPPPTVVR